MRVDSPAVRLPLTPTLSPGGEGEQPFPAKAGGFTDPLFATLNSFIVTPTRFGTLNWGKTIQELVHRHVLFMDDQRDAYVASIIRRLAA